MARPPRSVAANDGERARQLADRRASASEDHRTGHGGGLLPQRERCWGRSVRTPCPIGQCWPAPPVENVAGSGLQSARPLAVGPTAGDGSRVGLGRGGRRVLDGPADRSTHHAQQRVAGLGVGRLEVVVDPAPGATAPRRRGRRGPSAGVAARGGRGGEVEHGLLVGAGQAVDDLLQVGAGREQALVGRSLAPADLLGAALGSTGDLLGSASACSVASARVADASSSAWRRTVSAVSWASASSCSARSSSVVARLRMSVASSSARDASLQRSPRPRPAWLRRCCGPPAAPRRSPVGPAELVDRRLVCGCRGSASARIAAPRSARPGTGRRPRTRSLAASRTDALRCLGRASHRR